MNRPETSPGQAPGHHGTGDGESGPDDAPPQPAPKTDTKEPAPAASTPAVDASQESAGPSGSTTLGEDGNPVVFTPDDAGGLDLRALLSHPRTDRGRQRAVYS